MLEISNLDLSLMFVTDYQIDNSEDFFTILHQALAGGVSIVQLREKHLSGKKLYEKALKTKKLCDAANVPLIINDNVDIALAIDCAGIHLGQSDLPVEIARKLLGKDKIIGLSVSNIEETKNENTSFANYLGVSPLFDTSTKLENLAKPLGLAGLADLVKHTSLPLVSIGGIDESNATSAFTYGSSGIAVVSAISRSTNPKQSTQRLKALCKTGLKK